MKIFNFGEWRLHRWFVLSSCSLFAIPFRADSIQDEGIQDGRREEEFVFDGGAILSDWQSG